MANLLNITNEENQMASSPQLKKRLTHPVGFMMALEVNQTYKFFYDLAERPTNTSYLGIFYGFKQYDYLILQYPLAKMPDRIQFIGGSYLAQKYLPITPSNNHGDWYWDNDTYTISVLLMNKNKAFVDYPITFRVEKCRFVGCQPPVSPAYKLPVTSRPSDALFWSNLSTWAFATPGWGGFGQKMPKDNDSVLIPDGKFVVVDCQLPKLKYLQIEGVIEFDNNREHYLEVEMIFINGGQLIVGWEKNPILKNVEIVLTGRKDAMNFKLPDGLSLIGGKGIGVYGGLDLHGN